MRRELYEKVYVITTGPVSSLPPRLGYFSCFLSSADFFFKMNFFGNFFQEYHQSVKQFASRSMPTCFRAGLQRYQQTTLGGKELSQFRRVKLKRFSHPSVKCSGAQKKLLVEMVLSSIPPNKCFS